MTRPSTLYVPLHVLTPNGEAEAQLYAEGQVGSFPVFQTEDAAVKFSPSSQIMRITFDSDPLRGEVH